MTRVKNRSTPEGNDFWNHVEAVAKQVSEKRKQEEAMEEKAPELTVEQRLNIRELQLQEVISRGDAEDARTRHQTVGGYLSRQFQELEVEGYVLSAETLKYSKPAAPITKS